MTIKKTDKFRTKKSDSKHKMGALNSKSSSSRQTNKKRRNEFGDEDAI